MKMFFNSVMSLTANAGSEIVTGALNSIVDICIDVVLKLVLAAIVWFVGRALIKLLLKHFPNGPKHDKMDPTVRKFANSFIKIALYALLLVSIIAIMGVPMTSVVAVIASAGVTVGLALQGSLSNLAGGIMILIFKPFGVGDFIECGDVTGTVEEVSLFYTTVRSATNQRITAPNSDLSSARVINYSIYDTRRLDIDFEVAYGSDKNAVIEAIMSVVDANEKALKDPSPFLRMTAHGASSLVFTLRVWCARGDFAVLKSDLVEEIYEKFNAEGIEIPYQTIDVNIKKNDD